MNKCFKLWYYYTSINGSDAPVNYLYNYGTDAADAAQKQLDVYVSNLGAAFVETNYLMEKGPTYATSQQWGYLC